ncbi:Heterokaryon incompatibility protein [Rutstroemia sp. NJR-2017a BBW]|nr:Heterokaryon incompatibility protein [Rutstroemia sp. NJR-2017a BBW]
MENQENNQSYLYSPLPPGNIRLLRINADTSTSEIGSLEVMTLDAAPPYYALSHSWGAQNQSVAVQIDSQILFVSLDLAAGFRRFRELAAEYSELEPPVKYLWVDSVCINQNDIWERSSHVGLMGKIYSRSIKTLIWLGPDLNSSFATWQQIDRIYNIFRVQYPAATSPIDITVKMYSDSCHANSGLPEWRDELWAGLKELLELRWFSRIWVVQEVVLSPQDPIIIHGKHLYPWHRLGWAAAWMRYNGYIRLPQISQEFYNIDTICIIRRSLNKWPLDALMSITQIKFHATDQRDKVYALLGLAAEFQNASELPDSLRPDYSMDVPQLYQRVAHFLLQHNSSLAILTRTRGTSGSLTRRQRQYNFAEFPTWVPDWSDFHVFNREIRTSFSWIHYSDTSEAPRLGFPKQYGASAGRSLILHNEMNRALLRVSGIRVEKIIEVVPFNKEIVSNQDFKQAFASLMAKVCGVAISLLGKKSILSWATQFIKATTAEQHSLGGWTWDKGLTDGLAYLYNLLLHNEAQRLFFISKSGDDKAMSLLKQLSAGGEPEQFAALACNYCFNRSFMITSAGRMGIGPSDTHLGDTIAIIFGGGVPYVMRNQGSAWVFVGESYIEGLMDGEAIQACQQGVIQEEILDIR